VLLSAQRYLIFPGAATQGRPDAAVRAGEGEELLRLRAGTGDTIAALFGRALNADGSPRPDAARRPTVLFFYGNGMCLADCYHEFKTFRRLGANVMIPDFVGYGMSSGVAGEIGVYSTADAAYEHLLTRSDIDTGKIVPAGWSLGSGAAIHLASTRANTAHPAAGLMTFSAMTSVTDIARKLFPYLPTSLLLRHRFENEKKMHAVRCPVLIVHGRHDSIIPPAMAPRLAAAAGGPVTRLDVDTDHNDLFEKGGGELTGAIKKFLDAIALRPDP